MSDTADSDPDPDRDSAPATRTTPVTRTDDATATPDDWWRLTPEESRVPEDREDPVAECPYCGRPFEDSRARTLHVGEVHREACTDEERAAYEEADEAEVDDLFVYHLKAVVAIGLTWAAFVILYMVAIGSNII